MRDEADASHENVDDEGLSDEDREVEREVSSKENGDKTRPPEDASGTAESGRPNDSSPQEISPTRTPQSPLQVDPTIDPTLVASGSNPRPTDVVSNVGLPDDEANDRPAVSSIQRTSASRERSSAPEGPQTPSGQPAQANASATSSAGPITLAPDEPRAPKVLTRSTTGKGVAFTIEDVEFLVRFMAYRR